MGERGSIFGLAQLRAEEWRVDMVQPVACSGSIRCNVVVKKMVREGEGMIKFLIVLMMAATSGCVRIPDWVSPDVTDVVYASGGMQ